MVKSSGKFVALGVVGDGPWSVYSSSVDTQRTTGRRLAGICEATHDHVRDIFHPVVDEIRLMSVYRSRVAKGTRWALRLCLRSSHPCFQMPCGCARLLEVTWSLYRHGAAPDGLLRAHPVTPAPERGADAEVDPRWPPLASTPGTRWPVQEARSRARRIEDLNKNRTVIGRPREQANSCFLYQAGCCLIRLSR